MTSDVMVILDQNEFVSKIAIIHDFVGQNLKYAFGFVLWTPFQNPGSEWQTNLENIARKKNIFAVKNKKKQVRILLYSYHISMEGLDGMSKYIYRHIYSVCVCVRTNVTDSYINVFFTML